MPGTTITPSRGALLATTQLDRVPGRAPRLISIEQELSRGGHEAAQRLYDHDLAETPRLASYGAPDGGGFCTVKYDGSCDGEIVYGRLNLHDPDTAANLDDALVLLNDLKQEGRIRFGMSAGCHTHVGADRPTMLTARHVASLYHLFAHLEDPLYRIAAANYPRHRMDAGNGYSPVVPKGATRTAQAFRVMGGSRYGLNLSNYIEARAQCRCGAVSYGAEDECTCTLHKCTVEFRLWNATGNGTKLRAYAALSLALVDAASRKSFTPERYPPNEYRPHRPATERTREGYRLILENLPLGPTEREAVAYCIERAPTGSPRRTPIPREEAEGQEPDDDDADDDPEPEPDDWNDDPDDDPPPPRMTWPRPDGEPWAPPDDDHCSNPRCAPCYPQHYDEDENYIEPPAARFT